MFAKLSIAAIALAIAVPALAESDAACLTNDPSTFKTEAELTPLLTSQGLTVVQIKTENGCFEAYTTDAAGTKATLGFNAETLEPVDNAEAGEN